MPLQTLRLPVLAPELVSWRTVAPGLVEISVDLVNDSDEPTEPDDLVVEAAPLGAFVPFRPVTRIAVGALDPGERRRVVTSVPTVVLGGADFERFSRIFPNVEWIGNLNLWFDSAPEHAVEMHRAFDLRLSAGSSVCIAILVGTGNPGAVFDVETVCRDSGWEHDSFLQGIVAFVGVRAPSQPGCRGRIDVRVTRREDARVVPVEFTFETTAGRRETLGCVTL